MGIALLVMRLAPFRLSSATGPITVVTPAVSGILHYVRLVPVRTYHTRDIYDEKCRRNSDFEAIPLYVEGTLYFSTPFGKVIALDPVRGTLKWIFEWS